MVPVPEEQLPLRLPEIEKYQPTDTGESPLANIREWVDTKCPDCGGPAKRETDTMPNWAGSSWYYLRFCDPNNDKVFADEKKLKYWQPVDIYLGGAEHTTLHLLYSRFWHKFLNDLNLVPGKEPYQARRQHGVILGEDGLRMSKSKGNVINPLQMVEKFGADTLRLYLMFMGPYDATMAWNTAGIEGMGRFVNRLWKLFVNQKCTIRGVAAQHLGGSRIDSSEENFVTIKMHQTIKKVTEDIENFRYNTAISAIMEYVNVLTEYRVSGIKYLKPLALLLAPFAPHLAEEVWVEVLGQPFSVHTSAWPKYNPKLIQEEKTTVAVQVNGKLRGTLQVRSEQSGDKNEIIKKAKTCPQIVKWITKDPKKTVFVPGKLINFVV
jgi:leucyl-tRNA synthetase